MTIRICCPYCGHPSVFEPDDDLIIIPCKESSFSWTCLVCETKCVVSWALNEIHEGEDGQ